MREELGSVQCLYPVDSELGPVGSAANVPESPESAVVAPAP